MEEKMASSQLILVQGTVAGQRSDMYVVDLGAEKVIQIPAASLLNEAGQGGMVTLGPVIYNFGGESSAEDLDPEVINGDHHIHLGASSLELSIPHILDSLQKGEMDDCSKIGLNKWKAAPFMKCRRYDPVCASLGGKIYVLGGLTASSCIGEVFVPCHGQWTALHPPPSDVPSNPSCVSFPVIPDEKNDRLLVHFGSAYSLYAYYPDTGTWDCLAKRFSEPWFPTSALLDDVLYFHTEDAFNFLIAYDLISKNRLKVVYSSEFPVEICCSPYQDMLHLGNDRMCLANSCPIIKEDSTVHTSVQFVEFKVQRTSSAEVQITLIAVKCFVFEYYFRANRFFLL